MPLFQLESNTIGSINGIAGALTSCDNRNQTNGLKHFNLGQSVNVNNNAATTINTRLHSSHKASTNENLHLSSALSEVNFRPNKA